MDKQCPYCAETIKAEAIKCRYCMSDLSVRAKPAPDSGPLHIDPILPNPSDRPIDEAALRYEAEKKSAGLAYFLWMIFGTLGGHRYYFGRVASAVAMTALSIISLLLICTPAESSLFFIGSIGWGVVGIWTLVDAFQITGWAKEFNSALVSRLKANPNGERMAEEAVERPVASISQLPQSSQAISISICRKCRAQGSGDDAQCGRCGHAFA